MPIKFKCKNRGCGKTLQAKDDYAGKRFKCPACAHEQTVPTPDAAGGSRGPVSLVARFMGNGADDARRQGQIVANAGIERPLSLQLLFPETPALTSAELTRALRAYHPSLSGAVFEIDKETAERGTPIGLAGWGKHVIKLVGFNAPMPSESLERCVQPAHYAQELKTQARAHRAHVLLYYAGYDTSPLEEYVALAAVAGVLASRGAMVVLNESAHTSFPAKALAAKDAGEDILETLRALLLLLYCGFVKYEVEGVEGVWMRTYGAHLLLLPDFALLAEGHHQGEPVFEAFGNVFEYLLESGATLDVGHTMQVGDDLFVRLRAPQSDEYFLQSEGEMFVMEPISESEINRP